MKKKVICLLISAMIATSVLSGCGDKDADRRAEEAMNNLGEALENGDEDAAMSALAELDRLIEEEEAANSSESEEAYPADPRWADVKPTESAAQFNDVFIKTGMTLGEALEQIDNSDTFFAYYYDYDIDIPTQTQYYSKKDQSYMVQMYPGNVKIFYDGDRIFEITVPRELPGEEGDVYTLKDSPIIGLYMGNISTSYRGPCKYPEAYHTLLGTHKDITEMSNEDVQNLQNTLFAGTNAELDIQRGGSEGTKYITYMYKIPTTMSWNGYYTEEYQVCYYFEVNVDEDRVTDWHTEVFRSTNMKWFEE